LITAFNERDPESYERLFVMISGEMVRADRPVPESQGGRIIFLTPEERYGTMRRRVPVPSRLVALIPNERLEFYELQELPVEWLFDAEGEWIGCRPEGDGPGEVLTMTRSPCLCENRRSKAISR